MKTKEVNGDCREIFSIVGSLQDAEKKIETARKEMQDAELKIAKGKDQLIMGADYIAPLVGGTLKTESAVLRLRNLVNKLCQSSCLFEYNQMLNNDSILYGITFRKEGAAYRLTVPCLLPHYENKSNIITEPLNHFFRTYKKTNAIPILNSAVYVVINHTLGNNTIVRDNDNYEYKQLINTLTLWTLPDDSFKYVSMFNTTKRDKEEYTEVFIVPQESFPEWIAQNKEKVFSVENP